MGGKYISTVDLQAHLRPLLGMGVMVACSEEQNSVLMWRFGRLTTLLDSAVFAP